MPKWQETVEGARARYPEVMKALADKYPSENLLLVTHGKFLAWQCLIITNLIIKGFPNMLAINLRNMHLDIVIYSIFSDGLQ